MGSIDAKKKTGECMAKFKGISEFKNIYLFPLLYVVNNKIKIWPKNITCRMLSYFGNRRDILHVV